MPAAVKGFLARVTHLVAGFSIAQRTIAVIGAAVLVMGLFALGAWLTRPTYTPLFTGLSASDANAVVEQLRAGSVSYELADGGTTILVPQDVVYEQRLAAAAAGLPSSSSEGYSLLDEMGVTSSEFQQSVTYKRAIEGELAATIGSLEGVSAASVKLAIPEESVFVSERVEPTASVFVQTRNGATLSQKQVEAIVHLTAAAVSGMNPANVAVIDQSGNTLSAVGVDAAGGVDQSASDYETRVATGVRKLLETVVGPGNATVTVIADIDRSVTEQLSEVYTPADGAPPASEQVRTETQNGGAGNGAGVLGPDNIAVPNGGDGTYEATEETRNNVINKTVESRTTPAGSVVRQSVSVAVDTAAAEGVGVAKLRELVASAAGVDTERGDQITVELVRFSATDAEAAAAALKAAEEQAAAERTAAIVQTVVIAAAILLVVGAVIAFLVIRARRRARPVEEEFDKLFGDRPPPLSALPAFDAAEAPAPDGGAEPPTVPMTLEAPAADQPVPLEIDPDPDPGPEPAQIALQRRRAEIDALARTDPKRTADLLRRLLDERQPV